MPSTDPTGANPYADALRTELVSAHRRLAHRRRRRQRVAFGVVLLLVVGLATVLLSGPGAERAAADPLQIVPLPDGTTEVVLLDPTATPEAISAALDAARIPNVVRGTRTGPSYVGHFVDVFVIADGVKLDFTGTSLRIPAGFTGQLRILVGVPTPPGADYESGSMAFGPGEPFEHFTPADDAFALYTEARRLGFSVQIIGPDGTPASTVPPGAKVQVAAMRNARTLLLRYELP